MTFDAMTGLPELPPKHFWRVSRPNIIHHHEVQLRRKFLFVSLKVEYTQIAPAALSESRIREAAQYVLNKVTEQFGSAWMTGRHRTMRPELLGDYPPKSLP